MDQYFDILYLNSILSQLNYESIEILSVGATYQWIDCANGDTAITGATSATYTAIASGSYAVIISDNGCTDTSACIPVTLTDIDENSRTNNFAIYPNPTRGLLTVSLETLDNNARISVYSVSGQLVINQRVTDKKTIINLEDFDKGIYFVKIQNGDTVISEKIVKQ